MTKSTKAIWVFTIVAVIGSIIAGSDSDSFRNFLLWIIGANTTALAFNQIDEKEKIKNKDEE